MNVLEVRDNHGKVVRSDLIDGLGPIDVGVLLDGGGTVTITPMAGWQLNGHLVDCRCAVCRPDIGRLP